MSKMKGLFLPILLLLGLGAFAQKTKKVLFLGNSYTAVNNLPNLVASIANAQGNTLNASSNTPGGYTFEGHLTNSMSTILVAQGNWDYVVLQEQSQLPSFPESQVNEMMFPFAKSLDSLIHAYNACTQTVFYMTWGRKNGDASNCPFWPPVCTYKGMDSLLHLRYKMLAEQNKSLVSPVGAVWNYLRKNHANIELYDSDESHPSLAGSYAAACCFYALIFDENPLSISYNPGINPADAEDIRNAVKLVFTDSTASWNIGRFTAKPNFKTTLVKPLEVSFENNSVQAESYFWQFGDGDSSYDFAPTHTYKTAGVYEVNLYASKCDITNKISKSITLNTTGVNEKLEPLSSWKILPNPSSDLISITGVLTQVTRICIYNLKGQEIWSEPINNVLPKVNIGEFPEGFYFIELFGENGSLGQQKLLIQR